MSLEKVDEEILDLISIETQINSLKAELEPLQKRQKEIKQIILQEMEQSQVKLFDDDEIKISYVKPSPRVSFDYAGLKAKYPEIYDEFMKEVEISASLRVSLKGER